MVLVTYYKIGVYVWSTINRIIEFTKIRGLKQAYVCAQLGLEKTWMQTARKQNSNISDERLKKIAEILDTTVAYLKGETDDPSPDNKKSPSEVDELLSDPEISAMLELYRSWSPSERRRATSLLKALKESE